ncbi:uncharacterized protein LOC111391518 [Olea europaea var. sylvestris]|uniref:uncharacterized protein LOC111391518 n=1 Tax=Olea europaea var. sylvestris TaxID=158386 RepID=UPI000C1CD57B|nr:uncharacterized protein LOC111391518 [Olea europaea var. sylvestris]
MARVVVVIDNFGFDFWWCLSGGGDGNGDAIVVETEEDNSNFNDSDNDISSDADDPDIDDMEYPSIEELLSGVSSDDEVGYRFSEFRAEMDMRDPKFEVGQLFNSIQEFRKAIWAYGAVNGYNIKCKANDERRVQGIRKSECKWRIWASKMNNSETVQNQQFKVDPEWKTKSMQATIKEDLKVNITRNVAWKARTYAKQLINRTIEEQFVSLRSYATKVLRTNPGSTVMIGLSGQVFQGIYICFSACKLGFQHGCRKIIGVDGCHLWGVWASILLTAVGLDANDCIYPIAYVVVQKENKIAWR